MATLVTSNDEFCTYIFQDQHLPQRKFGPIWVSATLGARSCLIAEMSHALDGGKTSDASENFYHKNQQYFGKHLDNTRLDDVLLHRRYMELLEPYLKLNNGRGILLIIDGTDLAKPYARPHRKRGMQGASIVWDGSASKKGEDPVKNMGFEAIVITALLPNGMVLDIDLFAFSRTIADPTTGAVFLSDYHALVFALKRIRKYLGDEVRVVVDSGYFGEANMDLMDDLGLQFLVRIPTEAFGGTRKVTEASTGVATKLGEHLRRLEPNHTHVIRDAAADDQLTIRSAVTHLHLGSGKGKQEAVRTAMIAWFNDAPTPFALLASDKWDDTAETCALLRTMYRKRWKVETTIGNYKQRLGWGGNVEGFHVCKFRVIQRLLFGWVLAQGYLALERMKERTPEIAATVKRVSKRSNKKAKDPRRGLTRIIGEAFLRVLPGIVAKLFPPTPRGRPTWNEQQKVAQKKRRLQDVEREAKRLRTELGME